jgi:hypothetical protein
MIPMPAIARRLLIAGIALLAPSLGLAQMPDMRGGAGPAPWRKIPSVTVLWIADDARVQLVRDAVAYWNRLFAEIDTPFRLGQVSRAAETIPIEQLRELSGRAVTPAGRPDFPANLSQVQGDLIVALSDGDFISFGFTWPQQQKALVGIKDDRSLPLKLANVARNVTAHELGHAIGLRHNSDPTMLMCGRPASCRPDAFTDQTERFFPLTDGEKATLRAMYPADWPAR